MREQLEALLVEYRQIREAETAARDMLYRINSLAIAVVSGLLIGITTYKIEVLALVGPLVLYLVGFLFSSENLRLLRLTEYARRLEREIRRVLTTPGTEIIPGFEDFAHPGAGIGFFLSFNKSLVVSAIFYAIFYGLFFYFLAISSYSTELKITVIVGYLAFGAVLWVPDLWINRRYLFRGHY